MPWMLQSVESAPAWAEAPVDIKSGNSGMPRGPPVFLILAYPTYREKQEPISTESDNFLKIGVWLAQRFSMFFLAKTSLTPKEELWEQDPTSVCQNRHFYSLMVGHIAWDSHSALLPFANGSVLPGRFVARGRPFMCQMVDRR
jgi:hypothetical protein